MTETLLKPSDHPLAEYIYRLENGQALLIDTPENVPEVVGILKSYGVVLGAYSKNLVYIANEQFLELFPFFKYFDGDVSLKKLLAHWWHDRINFEYAEYCMKAMLWHGAAKMDNFLDSAEFMNLAGKAINAKLKRSIVIKSISNLFPQFLPEQIRQLAYYSALGQFWEVMNDIFITLSDRFDAGEIKTIPQIVSHILDGLVAAASNPITYSVKIDNQMYDILPASANLTFLMDVAVPYVEAVFFRGTPFLGTVSFNAQAHQIPDNQADFAYGALYADPLPIGGSGIPPTQLMQDMTHYLPEYLHSVFRTNCRGEADIKVQICQTFQKSMYCVTTAAIVGLAPFPMSTKNIEEQQANRTYLESWMDRFITSQLVVANQPSDRSCKLFVDRKY